jgi:hypothetical protein
MWVRPGRCLKVELIQASPPRAAALRELKEEMGTDNVEVLAESREWVCYDLPEHLVGKAWTGRWCGQRQKWFAMRFMGSDAGAPAYASSGKHHKASALGLPSNSSVSIQMTPGLENRPGCYRVC